MDWAKIDEAIDSRFSGVVQVRRRGEIVYARAVGLADRRHAIANALDTRFGIASGTKFLTALAIGKLIDAGELEFETRIDDVLPADAPRYAGQITIRHLLAHMSGIPDYYDEEKVTDFDNFQLEVPWSELRGPRDYLAVFPHEPMKFRPGERFSYSNSGYILLGVAIESISGRRYRDFVTEEVLQPSNMNDSGYFALDALPERTAIGYVVEPEGAWRTNAHDLPVIGASDGGAYATVDDIAKLWDAVWEHRILSPDLTKTMLEPFVEARSEGTNRHYGHGVWIREAPCGREHYLVGCDAGVSFHARVRRADALEVTVISNTTDGAWPIVRCVDDALAG